MADDLHVELEEVVADGIEFIEFEGDHAYCRYNKCETESKELVNYANTLAYLLTLNPWNIYFRIFLPHISCLYGPHIFFNCRVKLASVNSVEIRTFKLLSA